MTNSSALWFPLPHQKPHLLNLGSGELRWRRCRPSCGEGAGQRGGDESVLYTTAPAQRPSPPIYSFYTHRSACYTSALLPLTRSPGLPLHIRARARAASARARRPLPSPVDWQRQPAVTALQSLPSPPPARTRRCPARVSFSTASRVLASARCCENRTRAAPRNPPRPLATVYIST